jgi:hypothetical protein
MFVVAKSAAAQAAFHRIGSQCFAGISAACGWFTKDQQRQPDGDWQQEKAPREYRINPETGL